MGVRARFALYLRLPPPHCVASMPSYSAAYKALNVKGEDCSEFLPWLRRKAGTEISSVLSIGSSAYGRSLFATEPIQKGDCIMEVPHTVQLTQDKLPAEVLVLLGNDIENAAKVAVVLMMEQHLKHESGWATYVNSLTHKDILESK